MESAGDVGRDGLLTHGAREGLSRLLLAAQYADDTGDSLWSFASDIHSLERAGLTRNDLRWLLRKGYVSHRLEVTADGDAVRSFVAADLVNFTKASCFVLTEQGRSFTRAPTEHGAVTADVEHRPADTRTEGPASEQLGLPRWDADRRELSALGELIKRFAAPAPNQELILQAFQEEGWPPRVDDPLPPSPVIHPKQRLRDAIRSLN